MCININREKIDELPHIINVKRIRRIMQILGLKSVIRRKRPDYVKSTPEITAENILNRDFKATVPFEKWLTDVTEFKYYVGPEVKKLYLSAILDLYDRRIIAYKIGDSNNNELVFTTFDEATSLYPNAKPIFHSDRGFQYTNKVFHQKLVDAGTLQSYFRGREKDTIARDFDEFLCDSVADAILHFAKTAKAHTKKPVGFFYGYFLFAADIQYEGHLRLARVLRSPDVDFLASPTAYHFRAAASPSMEMTLTQSVNREKLYTSVTSNASHIMSAPHTVLSVIAFNLSIGGVINSIYRSF